VSAFNTDGLTRRRADGNRVGGGAGWFDIQLQRAAATSSAAAEE